MNYELLSARAIRPRPPTNSTSMTIKLKRLV
jgi:hypothetical protein